MHDAFHTKLFLKLSVNETMLRLLIPIDFQNGLNYMYCYLAQRFCLLLLVGLKVVFYQIRSQDWRLQHNLCSKFINDICIEAIFFIIFSDNDAKPRAKRILYLLPTHLNNRNAYQLEVKSVPLLHKTIIGNENN